METEITSFTEPRALLALGLSLLCLSSLTVPVLYGTFKEWRATSAKGTIPESRIKFGKTKNSNDLRDDDPLKWEINKYGPLNLMVNEMREENQD
jgi:hypothetical protein